MKLENEFHDHLDECRQCRDNPWNLCQAGADKLKRVALGDTLHDVFSAGPHTPWFFGPGRNPERRKP